MTEPATPEKACKENGADGEIGDESRSGSPGEKWLPEYQALHDECSENATFFYSDSSEQGQRLFAAFNAWRDFIRLSNALVQQIEAFAQHYDFDEKTPGNGYRSFVTVTHASVAYGRSICAQVLKCRTAMFFRKKHQMKEVESCSQLLSSLCTCLQYLIILHEWSGETRDLFACGSHSADELFEVGGTVNQYCFYGRCLGFQYSESIRAVLRFICIGMASYSETFYSHADDGALVKTTRSLWTSGKYVINPDLRARRIVNISQNARIDFCKSFWFLAESELMNMLPGICGSAIKVNRVTELPAVQLQLPSSRTRESSSTQDEPEFVDIPVPSSHIGPGLPVSVRLLSAKRRIGMIGEGYAHYRIWRKPQPAASKSILFHCHGGGFVAQSSKSHELYLRTWAVALDVPILSVDYSLAPEAPFPRALEEVFYAYCWLLQNAEHLGTTAERIVCAGDSAGANLCISLTLKCIEQGVRIPDGLFLAYCPTLISFVPSPARLLCLMDPLLPFGFMMRCLRAYAAPTVPALQRNAAAVEEAAFVRNMPPVNGSQLELPEEGPVSSSRRTSSATGRSPLSSIADNSKWDQIQNEHGAVGSAVMTDGNNAVDDETSDTFASASYHSQTVEPTDLPLTENDNSSCISFEEDSQPIVHYPADSRLADVFLDVASESNEGDRSQAFLDKFLVDSNSVEATEQTSDDELPPELQLGENMLTAEIIARRLKIDENNIAIETGQDVIANSTLQGRLQDAVNDFTTRFNRCTMSYEINREHQEQRARQDLRKMDALIVRSPSEEFAFEVPINPFLSPILASDEWLRQMPKTKIVSVDMDPCLDDCVMFAKKLKQLGRPVTLDILAGLPHGFLNFTMLSHEAMEGSKFCIKCLQELLEPPTENTPSEGESSAAKSEVTN